MTTTDTNIARLRTFITATSASGQEKSDALANLDSIAAKLPQRTILAVGDTVIDAAVVQAVAK
jgi:hypothetical protein